MFEVLFGFSVFAHDTFNRQDVSVSIMSEEPYFYPEIRTLSCRAKDFMSSCLNKACDARPSVSEAIGHPWMRTKTAKTESIDGRSSELGREIKEARFQTRPSRRSIQLPKLTESSSSDAESTHGPNGFDSQAPGSQAESPAETFMSQADVYSASRQGFTDGFAAASPREIRFRRYGSNSASHLANPEGPASEPRERSAVAEGAFDTGRIVTAGHAPAAQALMLDSFAFSAPARASCPPTTPSASCTKQQPWHTASSVLEPGASTSPMAIPGTNYKDESQRSAPPSVALDSLSFKSFSLSPSPPTSLLNPGEASGRFKSFSLSPSPPTFLLNPGDASGHPSPRRRVLNNSRSSKDTTFRPAADEGRRDESSADAFGTSPHSRQSRFVLSESFKLVDSAIF